MVLIVNNMDIDNLSKEKIMQLYQDTGMILGLNMVENTFVGKESFSQIEIQEFCKKRAKALEIGIEQFMKDNDISDDTVVEMD
jgi:hypothetical protein